MRTKNAKALHLVLPLVFMACNSEIANTVAPVPDAPEEEETAPVIEDENRELIPFADEFREAAEAAGVKSEPVPTYLTGDFADRTNVRLGALARCVYVTTADGPANYVEFFRDNWDKLSSYQKRKAYFHMQGKCLYELTDTGDGIMRTVVQGEGEILQDWPTWLDEFFSEAATKGF